MNDQAAWEQAVSAAGKLYFNLPDPKRAELDTLLEEIMQLKEQLVELAVSSGSSSICRTCGGECCLLGRYHVTVLDILAYVQTGTEPVAPNFGSRPNCPYSDSSGCLMTPRFRPVTCVIFNCQLIEDQLAPIGMEAFRGIENRLRTAVACADRIHINRIARPVLLSCN